MKSPQDLAAKLTHQWHNPRLREQRLLSKGPWPMELSIGLPGSRELSDSPQTIQAHLQQWRSVDIGEVIWVEKAYRNTRDAIALPKTWRLTRPQEWAQACHDRQVQQDYTLLSELVTQSDPLLHRQIIRDLPRWRDLSHGDIPMLIHLAQTLEPGMAQGKPLRAMTLGVDSKFLERHRSLLVRLLDQRFAGEVSDLGLERFLDAYAEQDHWLLLVPLQKDLLPFQRLRVRASELRHQPLPAPHILVVENEQCVHQLPELADCIAILGAGLNLNWMSAPWLKNKTLAYWGDLDTWGLKMLGQARQHQPHLKPLLMTQADFDANQAHAVTEPVPCPDPGPAGLTPQETTLYHFFKSQDKGRLEQEFIPEDQVHAGLRAWIDDITEAKN